jgi:hypothetical protein
VNFEMLYDEREARTREAACILIYMPVGL